MDDKLENRSALLVFPSRLNPQFLTGLIINSLLFGESSPCTQWPASLSVTIWIPFQGYNNCQLHYWNLNHPGKPVFLVPNEVCSDPRWVWEKLSEVKGAPDFALWGVQGPVHGATAGGVIAGGGGSQWPWEHSQQKKEENPFLNRLGESR